MIKSLQRRFIAIAMFSMALVLALIIAGINIANYVSVNQTLDERLQVLADNGGTFPDSSSSAGSPSSDVSSRYGDILDTEEELSLAPSVRRSISSLTAEAEYDTRYFTVTLHEDGTVYAINTGNISAISTGDASDYAATLYSRGKTAGYVGNYKYCVISILAYNSKGENAETMQMYIFLDCERELGTLHSYILASVGISILGLFLVFVLVVLLSRRALRPAKESYAKQKQFITDASHEIKTPLTIIDANTEIIEMMDGENEWTRSTRNQIRRLTALTEKMVFLTRMDEEGSHHMTMLDFSLSDAITETVGPFLAVAKTHGLTLEMDIEPNISYHGDETAIRQLVSLLLDNAIKYTSEFGTIRVHLQANGRGRRLSVWNTLDEITPGSHDELFDRFYRRDSSRSQEIRGHGIGLSVALAIVQAHKGKITAKSEDGRSIQFTITL